MEALETGRTLTNLLTVGLIGCGQIAQRAHLPALLHSPVARVAALADCDPVHLAAAQQNCPSAAVYDDYARLLDDPGIAAVVICLPTSAHAAASTAAFERGKHVYCEKPLATQLEDAEMVVRAWRRAGRLGMIGFNYRFNELHQRLRAQIAAGRVGEVVQMRSVFSTTSDVLTPWRQTRRTGGGVLLDLAAHHIDLVRFLLRQEVVRVAARIWSVRNDADTAVLDMELAGGPSAQSFFTYGSIEEDRIEVFGRAGKLSVDRYASLDVRMTRVHRGPSDHLDAIRRGLEVFGRAGYAIRKRRAPMHDPSYGLAMAHFVSAARGGGFVGPDMLDGYACAAVIEAAAAAAGSNRMVDVQAIAGGTA